MANANNHENGMANLMKTDIEVEVRTIRIGTLRTFPIELPPDQQPERPPGRPASTIPMSINEKGVKFSVKQRGENDDEMTVKIPTKRIKKVRAYLGRGCPVAWIYTDGVSARSIRTLFGMKRPGPYYDPNSEADAEQGIGVIFSDDPLSFMTSYTIGRIFTQISDKQKGKSGSDPFYKTITQKENNDKLVATTAFMEKMKKK